MDQQIHVDRPGQPAMREWMSAPPMRTGMGAAGEAVGSTGAWIRGLHTMAAGATRAPAAVRCAIEDRLA